MLKQVLEQDPGNVFARYGLAMEYAHAHQVDTALEEFTRVLNADPNYTAAYFQAAQVLARAERLDDARKWLRDGIACAERTGDQHAISEMQGMLDELSG